MTRKDMIKVARQEIGVWDASSKMPPGLPIAILFAFIHRLTTGETVEETFFPNKPTQIEYEI